MNREELETLCMNYLGEAEQVERARRPGDGLFGFGKKPADDPCHDRFAADIKQWLDDFRRSKPDSAEIRGVLEFVYCAPKNHPEPKSAYWMLIAVQSLTKELIPMLNRTDAAALAEAYTGLYKRRERMPAQKQLLDALNKAARS